MYDTVKLGLNIIDFLLLSLLTPASNKYLFRRNLSRVRRPYRECLHVEKIASNYFTSIGIAQFRVTEFLFEIRNRSVSFDRLDARLKTFFVYNIRSEINRYKKYCLKILSLNVVDVNYYYNK